jgi:hypothetical protein
MSEHAREYEIHISLPVVKSLAVLTGLAIALGGYSSTYPVRYTLWEISLGCRAQSEMKRWFPNETTHRMNFSRDFSRPRTTIHHEDFN